MIKRLLQDLDTKHLKSISGMDATFLYGESPTSPMHVGSVVIIEGALDFDKFKRIIASRIHQMPILRKRLVNVPFSVDYPYLADDPNFDLDLHMHHVALPQPGDWKQLRAMASDIFSQPMDLNKPLWSMTFVEGLNKLSQVPKKSVAVISKVHHAVIDGVAGASMLSIMFDMTKEVKKIPEPKPYNPKQLPNDVTLITKSAINFAKQPLRFPKMLTGALKATVKAGMLTRVQHLDPPTAPFTAPRTPLNGIISAQRKWNTTILELDRVKALKKIMGITLNDMVLAICAGALRRYLDEKDALPSKPLVALVPVSVRGKVDGAVAGNEISTMLVQLATDVDDPIERIETIYDNTTRSKTYQGALGAKTISNLGEVVPFGIANQAAKIYSRYNLARMHKPVFNLVVTNVPGPQFPMYIQGHKVHTIMGSAPLIDGMGLMIVVFSYNGKITITVTSDEKSMPDLDVFSNYIRESANETEKVVLDYEKKGKQKKKKSVKKQKAESDLLFENVKAYLKKNPTFLRPDSGVYQFNVNGTANAQWQVNFSKAPGTIRKGKAKNPDATFTIKDKHLAKIGRGEMKLQTAMIQGRLTVDGDYNRAMQLGKILMKILKEQNS
jgi:WS/DGAT/MGAT family acyltransferase